VNVIHWLLGLPRRPTNPNAAHWKKPRKLRTVI